MSNSLRLAYPSVDDALDEIGEVSLQMYDLSAYFAALNLDDQDTDSWHDPAANLSLSLSLRYQDIGTDPIQIGYSHDGTTETLETVVTKTNTGLWKWKHYTLASTARMAHGVYEGFDNADFRLTCVSDLGLTNVSLRNVTTKAHLDWKAADEQPTDVDGTAIQDATITAAQIANATITGTQIANATITATNIANATITATQIANATITGTQIANATITGSNIASATIAGSNIANATITATQIANGTITSAQIASGTILGSNIAAATITGANIDAATITATNIQNATITATQIANLTITASQIANATITGAKIASATITGGLIASATITGSNIAGGTITGSNIAGSTITGANIQNSTITGGLIANATITGSNIAATTITASNIASGTITATQIASGTITATQLSATAIDSMTVTGATIRTASSGARTEMNSSNLFGLGFGGIGGTNGTTTQWYAKASDGKIYFAAGGGIISASGLQYNVETGSAGTKVLEWLDGANSVVSVGAWKNASPNEYRGRIDVNGGVVSGYAGDFRLNVYAGASSTANLEIMTWYSTAGAGFYITNSSSARGIQSVGTITPYTHNADDLGSAANNYKNLFLTSVAYIGNATSNTNMTKGITLKNATGDEIFTVKRGSVAHGMTGITETDTYGFITVNQGTSGSLQLNGLSASTIGIEFDGYMTTGNTTRGTTAVGAIVANGFKKSGSSYAALGTNENIFVVRDASSTRFIVDKEGDIHMDATSNINAWDDHDDVALLEAFRVKTAGVNFKRQFARDIEAHARVLHETGVLTLNEDGHHFASIKGLFGLTIDAIRQLAQKVERYERALATLGVDVRALEA